MGVERALPPPKRILRCRRRREQAVLRRGSGGDGRGSRARACIALMNKTDLGQVQRGVRSAVLTTSCRSRRRPGGRNCSNRRWTCVRGRCACDGSLLTNRGRPRPSSRPATVCALAQRSMQRATPTPSSSTWRPQLLALGEVTPTFARGTSQIEFLNAFCVGKINFLRT